jgi:tetratricopeptide (TPR) repeat protein
MCARVGSEQALEPWPFYKLIVGLKTRAGSKDPDVVRALEGLAAEYPSENIWSERLGEVYFLQGQTERAMGVLQDAIAREQGQKKASPRTYMLAAESARCEGKPGRAVSILRLARNRYPDDINVLNNLAYSLAQAQESIGQALALVPDLLGKGGEDFAILDTVALIYLRSGDLKAAELYMKKAITRVKKGDYAWIEVYLNAAETQIKLGKFKEARESLNLVMKTPERSPAMDARAKELQGELTLREREKQGWF